MKLPSHINSIITLVIFSAFMTLFFLDIQNLKTIKHRVNDNLIQLKSLESRYKAVLYQRYSFKLLISTLEKKLSTTVTKLGQHEELVLLFNTTKHGKDLLATVKHLNQYLGPINELSIDFLNQYIELRLPLK